MFLKLLKENQVGIFLAFKELYIMQKWRFNCQKINSVEVAVL